MGLSFHSCVWQISSLRDAVRLRPLESGSWGLMSAALVSWGPMARGHTTRPCTRPTGGQAPTHPHTGTHWALPSPPLQPRTPSWLASVVECSNTNKHLGAISIYICCSFLLIPCLCGCCGDSLLAVATACVRPAMWDGQNHVRNNSQRQALLKENL